jgi:transposase
MRSALTCFSLSHANQRSTRLSHDVLTVQGLSNREIPHALGITSLAVQQLLKHLREDRRGELVGRLSRD